MQNPLNRALLVFGIVTGWISILVADGWLRTTGIGISVTIAVYLAYSLISLRRRAQVDSPERIFAGPYKTEGAVPGDFDWICNTAIKVYSGIDLIPKTLMLQWYSMNPTGFTVIRDASGHLCGNLDILPLRPEYLEMFIEGKIVEQEIKPAFLYSSTEKTMIADLYIESFVAVDASCYSNAWAAYECLTSVHSIVTRICSPDQIKHVYAIAASKAGHELVKHLGFTQIQDSSNRKDQHDLFYVKFHDLVSNIAATARPSAQHEILRLLNATRNGGSTL